MSRDISGLKTGRLLVIEKDGKTSYGNIKWLCICECGNQVSIDEYSLTREKGATKSCGCLAKEIHEKTHRKYTKADLEVANIWENQRKRCNNPSEINYENYGGRGIKCVWSRDEAIIWARNNPRPSKEYQMDRIDNNGNYEAINMRWSTRSENMMNRSNSINIETYSKKPTLRHSFKTACKNHNWDFNNFNEILADEELWLIRKDGFKEKKYFYELKTTENNGVEING